MPILPLATSKLRNFRPLRRGLAGTVCLGASLCVFVAGIPGQSKLKLDTGKEIYQAGCVSCHGRDGKGQSQSLSGFEKPATFPDFSDCAGATPEPDIQWRAVITNGGPARAFSEIMPSFKDQLTAEQIVKVVGYLRTICSDKSWPQGDLNLPRAIITEKAYVENETVITGAFNAHGEPGAGTSVVYEKRIGSRAMIEAIIPYNFTHGNGAWNSGFGDIALGYKRVMYHNLKKGSIFSLGGELIAPTGNKAIGTGGESTVFETYAAFGQLFKNDAFLQMHTGVELPLHPDILPRAYYLRSAVGKTFSTNKGLGRRWSPMAEFIFDRDLVTGAKNNLDIVPEMQFPLSKRLHVLGSIGFKIPVNNTAGRPKQLMFYLLWDYADGKVTQGW
jgi:mono/diheme cytochrome c family protein